MLPRIKVGQKLIRLLQQPAQDDKRDKGRGLRGDCNEVKSSPIPCISAMLHFRVFRFTESLCMLPFCTEPILMVTRNVLS